MASYQCVTTQYGGNLIYVVIKIVLIQILTQNSNLKRKTFEITLVSKNTQNFSLPETTKYRKINGKTTLKDHKIHNPKSLLLLIIIKPLNINK